MQDTIPQQTQDSLTAGGGLDLKSLLSMLIRRRWVILCVSLPIIIVTAFVTLQATEKTTARARLMIIGNRPETPDFLQRTTNWDLELSSASQIVMSLPVARLAAEAMFDTVQVLAAQDPTFPVFESVDDILASVADEVDCTQVGESNILNITYSHIHRGYTLLVVKEIIDAYMNFSIKSQQNLPAVEYYTDQIENLRAHIDDFFQQRVDIVKEAGIAALADNAGAVVNQIQNIRTNMFNVRSDRLALQARLQSILGAIATDSTYVPTSVQNQGNYFGILKERADMLTSQLADLRSQFKPGAGQIEFKERQLQEVWRELNRDRENFLQDINVRLDEMNSKEQSYLETIFEQEEQLENYPDVQRRIDAVDVQIKSQLDLLETLELKLGEVKLKAGADLRVTNIFPLDAPAVHMSLAGSKKQLYLVMSFIFAVLLGLIAGWFVDNQDHRIYDRSQAMQALKVPVLGAISPDKPDARS